MNETAPQTPPESPPEATLERRPRWSWAYVLPVAAVLIAAGLGYQAWRERGPTVHVTLDDGHGLKPGDDVRFRGIVVGTIRDVSLAGDLGSVTLEVRLDPDARGVAAAGSRFWVVRPQIGLEGVAGAETVIGPRYLAVLPGDGEFTDRFTGLDAPPVRATLEPGGLEIKLKADAAGGIRPGSPVAYRQITVGKVVSVELDRDADAVVVLAYIEPGHVDLVRTNTRFWNTSGVGMDIGLTGVSWRLESLQALVTGGIAMANPDDPGPRITTGHVFRLHPEPDEDWATQ